MARTIVLLFDGTSNEISEDRTNILRLYGTLQKSPSQIVYYDPGVGTMGMPSWSKLSQQVSEVFQMATGRGLDANVEEAYRFLVETCDRLDGRVVDRICLIGFSRGGYTAQVLAGFLHAFGLMAPRNLNLLDYAYRAFKCIDQAASPASCAEIDLFQRVIRPDRAPVAFVGLFDAVASVIESGRFGPRLRNHAFTSQNPSVAVLRHAVALSERRTMFRPLLWPEGQDYNPLGRAAAAAGATAEQNQKQDHKEVWFYGYHADIGGGLPDASSALAKVPLRWMIREMEAAGLTHDPGVVAQLVAGASGDYVAPDPRGKAHDSMTMLWKLLEWMPRRRAAGSTRRAVLGWTIPRAEPRRPSEGARIHRSVLEAGRRLTHGPTKYRVED
ncbi:MAG: DUF2235 domain-containing protein [Pseudomonadota bacterium]